MSVRALFLIVSSFFTSKMLKMPTPNDNMAPCLEYNLLKDNFRDLLSRDGEEFIYIRHKIVFTVK